MKTITGSFCGLLATLLLCFSPQAHAIPPTGRHWQGQVVNIDVPAKQIVIKFDDPKHGTKSYVWVRRTVVWNRGVRSQASDIRPGERVKAVCHRPIFGPPFVSRIIVPK